LVGVLALLAVSMAAPASAVSVGATRTRWVDDDGRAGPRGCGGSKAATRHIQSAIDRSDRNDVVIVCPGRYSEEIGIVGRRLAGLTVRAYAKGTAIVKVPASVTYGPPIWIERVSGVTVQGLAFEFPSTGCDEHSGDLQGVWIQDADGVRFQGNRFWTSGSDTQGPCGYEDGIRVLSSAHARIANNTVRDFKSDGISIEDHTTATVDGNTIQFYHRASGSEDDGDQGIRVVGGARAEVTDNLVRSLSGSGTPHLEIGIIVQDGARGSDIHHNEVRYVEQGLGVLGARAKLRYNDVVGTGGDGLSGIFADGAAGIEVLANRVRGFDYGIWVDAKGTTLRHNDARGNVTLSCKDTTTGTGTAGTANLWSGSNVGSPTSDPVGICQAP